MAPLASEPRQVLTVLNPARRKALYTLLVEITAFMRSQIEFHESTGNSGSAPLLIDPSAENSIIIPGEAAAADSTPPSPALVRLRTAAIEHFDAWRKDVLAKLKELLSTPDDAAVVEERRKRAERVTQQQQRQQGTQSRTRSSAGHRADLMGALDARPENESEGTMGRGNEEDPAQAVARLQAHWHPIPTRLVTIPEVDRKEALSCVLLVLLSTGHYSAHSRALAVYLTSALELPLAVLNAEEVEIAKSLVERSAEAARQQRTMSADAEAEQRKQQNQASRYWKVGLASVAGAAIIGVTGGLAAPVVAGAIGGLMGSVGLGGVASFLGIFWMNGALVGTLFGAFGAKMTGEMVDRYARQVEDFRFVPLKDEWGTRSATQDDRRLRVTIGINGWLNAKDDITKPWRALGDDSEAFALRYEVKSLLGLGQSLKELVSSYAWNTVKLEILKRTVLATLWSALWPAYILSAASAVDNPFSLAKNRSEKAGEILADALINKVQGERPVTLVGYSLGARVIYSCLRSLAARRAFGLIDTVVFIGAPVPSNKQHWDMMRAVVSGKMFNVYSENDYLLAFLYRATSIQLGVAGLQEIKDIEGVENLNLSEEVQGHMRYAKLIPQILARCGIPVVRGADGPIEEDEDSIRLADLDKDGTDLIDLEGQAGSPALVPASASAVPMSQMPYAAKPPSPALASSHSAVDYKDDDDDDSDEEGGTGIQMVDHDEDGLTHCDPTPIDDY
ncbi:98075c87-9add-4a16-9265-e4c967128bbe [Thermothielavioides terrestris]|uniref:98075c87-9add-4a16-9265-e4c967128bbe n=1 Tax=Thermothielavioides terrestris TaxID=2587410 RepID=A0A446B638_9PEZI|nr:98075c87-9add-4a16-9265-e4c967128bbe [Thermothielavioides terrestris]